MWRRVTCPPSTCPDGTWLDDRSLSEAPSFLRLCCSRCRRPIQQSGRQGHGEGELLLPPCAALAPSAESKEGSPSPSPGSPQAPIAGQFPSEAGGFEAAAPRGQALPGGPAMRSVSPSARCASRRPPSPLLRLCDLFSRGAAG